MLIGSFDPTTHAFANHQLKMGIYAFKAQGIAADRSDHLWMSANGTYAYQFDPYTSVSENYQKAVSGSQIAWSWYRGHAAASSSSPGNSSTTASTDLYRHVHSDAVAGVGDHGAIPPRAASLGSPIRTTTPSACSIRPPAIPPISPSLHPARPLGPSPRARPRAVLHRAERRPTAGSTPSPTPSPSTLTPDRQHSCPGGCTAGPDGDIWSH